jgi:succinate dehydrogenase/fumarate reductase flavoprotein subunit
LHRSAQRGGEQDRMQFDAVIVGGGLAGLVAAAELAD